MGPGVNAAAPEVRAGGHLRSTEKIDQRHLAGNRPVVGDDNKDTTAMNTRTELVGRIAAGLAHDLNGPIGVMLGFTRLALEKLEADDSASVTGIVEYLKMIENAGENARDLAKDMWDFARMTPGEIREFEFVELLEKSARLVAPSLRVAAIEPPVSGELRAQTVTGDRAMWAHALVGVMINAPTALPGGGSVSLKLERHPDGTTLGLELIASPNEPGVSAAPPAPAQDWVCGDSARAVIDGLGGSLRSSSRLSVEQSGIEIIIPVGASGGRD